MFPAVQMFEEISVKMNSSIIWAALHIHTLLLEHENLCLFTSLKKSLEKQSWLLNKSYVRTPLRLQLWKHNLEAVTLFLGDSMWSGQSPPLIFLSSSAAPDTQSSWISSSCAAVILDKYLRVYRLRRALTDSISIFLLPHLTEYHSERNERENTQWLALTSCVTE